MDIRTAAIDVIEESPFDEEAQITRQGVAGGVVA